MMCTFHTKKRRTSTTEKKLTLVNYKAPAMARSVCTCHDDVDKNVYDECRREADWVGRKIRMRGFLEGEKTFFFYDMFMRENRV